MKKIATDVNLQYMRMQMVSRCYCYEEYQQVTMEHLFLMAPTIQKLQRYFANIVGLKVQVVHLQHMITQWWEYRDLIKLRVICRAVPTVIVWELWKRRTSRRYGKYISLLQLIKLCEYTLNQFIQSSYPQIQCPSRWEEVIKVFHQYKPRSLSRILFGKSQIMER